MLNANFESNNNVRQLSKMMPFYVDDEESKIVDVVELIFVKFTSQFVAVQM